MPQYTAEQRYTLIKKFNDMDINGDKQLSKDEIRKCVEASSLPPEKVDVRILFKPGLMQIYSSHLTFIYWKNKHPFQFHFR